MSQITQEQERWNISGEVGIHTANALLNASKQLQLSANTVIDFAQVTDIDTAAISLILEWKRRAQLEKASVQLANMPANLKSLVDVYGLADLLN